MLQQRGLYYVFLYNLARMQIGQAHACPECRIIIIINICELNDRRKLFERCYRDTTLKRLAGSADVINRFWPYDSAAAVLAIFPALPVVIGGNVPSVDLRHRRLDGAVDCLWRR